MQFTVIREGSFWTSEFCRFGNTFGSVEAQCPDRREPKEYFERVPKQSTVNRGTGRCVPHTAGGGPRHLSCNRGRQLKAQNMKEISVEEPPETWPVADGILKALCFALWV